MRDPLWGTTWRVSAGALALAAVASAVLLSIGRPLDAAGLLVGALISGANFLATGRFLQRARGAAAHSAASPPPESEQAVPSPVPRSELETRRLVAASNRAAFGFVVRYLAIGALLVVLILGFGLPPATTVLGVAAVPLTIYLWQMGRIVTGGWRRGAG